MSFIHKKKKLIWLWSDETERDLQFTIETQAWMKFRKILVSNYGHKLLCHRNLNQTRDYNFLLRLTSFLKRRSGCWKAVFHSRKSTVNSRKFHRIVKKQIRFDCAKIFILLRSFFLRCFHLKLSQLPELIWQMFLCRVFSFNCLHLSNNQTFILAHLKQRISIVDDHKKENLTAAELNGKEKKKKWNNFGSFFYCLGET